MRGVSTLLAALDVLKDPSALESMSEDAKAGLQRQLQKIQGGLAAVLQRITGGGAGDDPNGKSN
jgi:hypothetical protein